jgi:hypothetical protein
MKPWYESKTVWLNVTIILIAILTAVSQHQDIIGSTASSIIIVTLSVFGVINRFLAENPPLSWK